MQPGRRALFDDAGVHGGRRARRFGFAALGNGLALAARTEGPPMVRALLPRAESWLRLPSHTQEQLHGPLQPRVGNTPTTLLACCSAAAVAANAACNRELRLSLHTCGLTQVHVHAFNDHAGHVGYLGWRRQVIHITRIGRALLPESGVLYRGARTSLTRRPSSLTRPSDRGTNRCGHTSLKTAHWPAGSRHTTSFSARSSTWFGLSGSRSLGL